MADQSKETREGDGESQADASRRLEDKRLALDWARLRGERQRAAAELYLKRQEIKNTKTKGWRDALANPVVLAIVGGFVTIMTTIISNNFTVSANIKLEGTKAELASKAEREKAERADKAARLTLQADLIKKFVENPRPEAVRENLKFLADAGLIPDYKKDISDYLSQNPTSAPQVGPPGPTTNNPRVLTPDELNGFVIHVTRTHVEQREGRRRTIGRYRVTYEGQELTGLSGFTAESGGPGNNATPGRGARLQEGGYPLSTWGGNNYVTIGYASAIEPTARPKPAIGLKETGARVGIIVHPGTGFLSAVGTVNLSRPLGGPMANIDYPDSRERVIALISAMKAKIGNKFPAGNDQLIPNAWISITGEPMDKSEN